MEVLDHLLEIYFFFNNFQNYQLNFYWNERSVNWIPDSSRWLRTITRSKWRIKYITPVKQREKTNRSRLVSLGSWKLLCGLPRGLFWVRQSDLIPLMACPGARGANLVQNPPLGWRTAPDHCIYYQGSAF